MWIEPVALPARSCQAVSRPSVVAATTWGTPCRRIASAPGRAKSTVAAAGVGEGVGGQSQNTASAPRNA